MTQPAWWLTAGSHRRAVSRNRRLDIRFPSDPRWAQVETIRFAREIGFSRRDATGIAIAVSELATNLLTHASRGAIVLTELRDRPGLSVEAIDEGPSIPDVAAALQDGFSRGVRVDDPFTVSPADRESLGCGLGAVQRLMDELSVESSPGRGTRVTARKYLKRQEPL
ncbi:MAG: anti-sigma regulatory factor [Candidatus Riflebacteria bacterium]|nr:anti-sigma regulatory factor [Candidatus Riflebacteria bacterium]